LGAHQTREWPGCDTESSVKTSLKISGGRGGQLYDTLDNGCRVDRHSREGARRRSRRALTTPLRWDRLSACRSARREQSSCVFTFSTIETVRTTLRNPWT